MNKSKINHSRLSFECGAGTADHYINGCATGGSEIKNKAYLV
jgi:hypothetical protein